VTLVPGGTAPVTVNFCSTNGFSGTVDFTARPVPIVHHRLRVVPRTGSVTVAAPANDCATGLPIPLALTIVTTSSLLPGVYEIAVAGSVSGTAGAFTVITVNVT
jgi:hypothetical protein